MQGILKNPPLPYKMTLSPTTLSPLAATPPARPTIWSNTPPVPPTRIQKQNTSLWGDQAFPRMLEELEKAEHYIFLEYFIIQPGIFWDSILAILERKAAQGVEVRVMYDDMGCMFTLPRL